MHKKSAEMAFRQANPIPPTTPLFPRGPEASASVIGVSHRRARAGGGLKHVSCSEGSYRDVIRTLCLMVARSVQAPPESRQKSRQKSRHKKSGHKKSQERMPPA